MIVADYTVSLIWVLIVLGIIALLILIFRGWPFR